MCLKDGELAAHLFIHCPNAKAIWAHLFNHSRIAKALWAVVLARWGMSRIFPVTMVELIQQWNGTRVDRRRQKLWRLISLCLTWLIWRERGES